LSKGERRIFGSVVFSVILNNFFSNLFLPRFSPAMSRFQVSQDVKGQPDFALVSQDAIGKDDDPSVAGRTVHWVSKSVSFKLQVGSKNLPLHLASFSATLVYDREDPLFAASEFGATDGDVPISGVLASPVRLTAERNIQKGQTVVNLQARVFALSSQHEVPHFRIRVSAEFPAGNSKLSSASVLTHPLHVVSKPHCVEGRHLPTARHTQARHRLPDQSKKRKANAPAPTLTPDDRPALKRRRTDAVSETLAALSAKLERVVAAQDAIGAELDELVKATASQGDAFQSSLQRAANKLAALSAVSDQERETELASKAVQNLDSNSFLALCDLAARAQRHGLTLAAAPAAIEQPAFSFPEELKLEGDTDVVLNSDVEVPSSPFEADDEVNRSNEMMFPDSPDDYTEAVDSARLSRFIETGDAGFSDSSDIEAVASPFDNYDPLGSSPSSPIHDDFALLGSSSSSPIHDFGLETLEFPKDAGIPWKFDTPWQYDHADATVA
jgi:hypothetical protein